MRARRPPELPAAAVAEFERELGADLESGRWDARHGALRTLPEFDGSLRLVTARTARVMSRPGTCGASRV